MIECSETMQGAEPNEFTRTAIPRGAHITQTTLTPEEMLDAGRQSISVLGAERAIPAHQKRVISEKLDLDEKLRQLLVFIEYSHATFGSLSKEEQSRLRKQAEVMRQYSSILADRIALFGVERK